MANGGGSRLELELKPFAAAVARLSDHTIRIDIRNDWRRRTGSYEPGVIGDIKAGRVDLAWMASRAFDGAGVASFDALHAPLLIDSYTLQQKVLASPLVEAMLGGLKPLGVVGLGILPGSMRKPLGVSRLVRPADYRGKTIAISPSRVAEQSLRGLGARASKATVQGGGAFDGFEAPVEAIDAYSFDNVGRYLATNVNLWPRPLVVFINKRAFASLTDTQRDALRGAARSALPATSGVQRHDEKESAGNLCRRGLKFVTARSADLESLRRALEPVYDRLERDRTTGAAIDRIRGMRPAPDSRREALSCSRASSTTGAAGKATPIDGVYRLHFTARDLLAAGSPDANPENYGDYRFVLSRGRFTQKHPSSGDASAGKYAVKGDTLTFTIDEAAGGRVKNEPGERFTFRWSLYRDQLTLKPVPEKISPLGLTVNPWRRVGDAPASLGAPAGGGSGITPVDAVF